MREDWAREIDVFETQIELRKKCFEATKKTLEVPEPMDYDAPPVKLLESVGSLQLTSDPPGALIFLDGESMGQTPRELERVCSGKHRLEVKHASGKFIQDIVLARNEALSLDCPIRPSLAYLGVVAESAAGERVAPEVEEKLLQNLGKLTTLNFIPAPRETADRLLERGQRRFLLPGGRIGARNADAMIAIAHKIDIADLEQFDRRHGLQRIHGGVKANPTFGVGARTRQEGAGKIAITANAAHNFIEPHHLRAHFHLLSRFEPFRHLLKTDQVGAPS